jgi:FKBP-type peptidyl-prolyl cis-trans isomerase FkpA
MRKIILPLILAFFFTGCFKDQEPTCDYSECSLKAPATEITEVEDYLAANNITGAVKHCSGLYYKIEYPGAGNMPNYCSTIAIKYKGMFKNGNVFDQTTTDPAVFQLNTLIPGWRNTLPLLKTGGKISLYVPPALGYGAREIRDRDGNIVIPANSMLIFEVELIAVG